MSSSSRKFSIYTLPTAQTNNGNKSNIPNLSIKEQIEFGLKGTNEIIYPGNEEEDKKWGFKRSVPTLVLYDEEGLRLYDKITSSAPEYYPFPDELNLLKENGLEISKSMGFIPKNKNKTKMKKSPKNEKMNQDEIPEKPWKPAKWGDVALGKYNNGVNGEQGLGGKEGNRERDFKDGWDIVELGAGALRKTAHLLLALSSAVTPSEDGIAPIRYHPLDLSEPELHRVLGEMEDGYGDQLRGKVTCIGLHGDYDAGLELIRQGKLSSLDAQDSSRESAGLGLEDLPESSFREHHNLKSNGSIEIPSKREEPREDSPILSPELVKIITPQSVISLLPSEITDSQPSCTTNSDNSGTWSPISSDSETRYHQQPNAEKIKDSFLHTTTTTEETKTRPLHMVFLGSSLGNFDRESAIPFLKSLPLKAGDTLLLGLDGRPTPGHEGKRKIEVAYNDPAGHTKRFEEHGWDVVKAELGLDESNEVEFVGRYNEVLGRHEAYFRSIDKQTIHLPCSNEDITLEEGELLNIEWSYKYSLSEALNLFSKANLRVINTWKAPDSEYRLWLLERPQVIFPTPASIALKDDRMVLERVEAAGDQVARAVGVPKWNDWLDLWQFWDHITLQMIPKEMLHKKPIDLRHICLFYLGHIPTFLDIHLTRLTKGSHTEPEYFKTIFERGIDPDVDDPTKCHDHSEVPMSEEDWPSLPEILSFRDRVRLRLKGIYDSLSTGQKQFTRHTGRVLFMTYEHEAMHAETLLYMLAQSDLTRPPTAVSTPQWEILAKEWNSNNQENKLLTFEGGQIELGHRDLESEDENHLTGETWENHEFGWDNEHPNIIKKVKSFKIDSLTITNQDYLNYLKSIDKYSNLTKDLAPASWVLNEQTNEWEIRSLYGSLSFDIAGKWPLMASKIEIENYANWKGGRLPKEEELKFLWTSEIGPKTIGEGINTGIKNWHPIPPTNTFKDNSGNLIYGNNGGVWEWTNTPFDELNKNENGFIPSILYPGYSKDFFDEKHFIVLGGSFVTIPSISSRKSFRNWYQSNYKFSFIGGRVAYDF
ncbi:uncharacterized protein I206_101971 [Kwoniella pini CBS 10737]|uniref:Sulfatase-modifying factor enzyme domain-containing protein n=1 Tax=Kwoniella pini CBS 10737 TaxID=1296096 RepID=A0A1B9HV61_9TREE|nr:uncharacterized protein I206_06938 [Kwoniella pini CBS 10737]OCF47160.1 hypothetical protein I206_06938 [Kwoniella pini CBS 10737]